MNMKGILFIAFGMLLIFATCRKSSDGVASGTPRCVHDEITDNQTNEDWMIGSVEEYLFQNKLVYAFQPDETKIADGATTIKDEHCNTICSVGGFGGPSINLCNGENFFQLAVLKRTIWKKK
jgi:hypothetical protein